jgi:hypothetical protein
MACWASCACTPTGTIDLSMDQTTSMAYEQGAHHLVLAQLASLWRLEVGRLPRHLLTDVVSQLSEPGGNDSSNSSNSDLEDESSGCGCNSWADSVGVLCKPLWYATHFMKKTGRHTGRATMLLPRTPYGPLREYKQPPAARYVVCPATQPYPPSRQIPCVAEWVGNSVGSARIANCPTIGSNANLPQLRLTCSARPLPACEPV